MRSRSRVLSPTVYQSTFTDWVVGGWTDESEGPFATSFHDESMKDVVVPDFGRKIKSGAIIENPCTYRNSSLTSTGSGNVIYEIRAGGTVIHRAVGTGPITARTLSRAGFEPTLPDDDDIVSSLIAESRLAALGYIDPSAIATGEDLLELGETLRFLKSPLKGIFNALSKKGIRSAADLTADVWLSLRFGITPLVVSINDILNEAGEFTRTRKPPKLMAARGIKNHSKFISGTNSFGSPSAAHEVYWTAEAEYQVKSTIHYTVAEAIRDWKWRYGFRGSDGIPTMWAVVPLSFMVDRIYDVSSAIKGFQALTDPKVKILGASTVVRKTLRTSAQVVSCSTTDANATYSGKGELRDRVFFSYDRTPYIPSLSDLRAPVKLGSLTKDLTSIADLASLIYSRIRK